MTIIQFLLVVFALFAITKTFRQFKNGKLTLAFLFLWILFWAIVGVVVVLPQTTDTLARFVGVGRGVDAIMYVSIIALFYGKFDASFIIYSANGMKSIFNKIYKNFFN